MEHPTVEIAEESMADSTVTLLRPRDAEPPNSLGLGNWPPLMMMIMMMMIMMGIKIIIFEFLTLLTNYFTMLIVSGMYFSCGFHP